MFQHSDLPTLHRMQASAQRVRDMIYDRAVVEYYAAFGRPIPDCASNGNRLGRTLDMCVIHNSLVSREQGRPWAEINYDHMRRAAWLIEQSYKPDRLVHAWYNRKCGLPTEAM